MTRRTRRSVAGSVLAVLALVIGAVVATALRAEGRERSRADTNDGGAWLLKRDAGYVGHVNRLVGEVAAAVSVADPGSDYDVDQARGIIVVHDRTTGLVTLVDDSVSRVANPAGVRVGPDVSVHAVDGGALIVDRAAMSVWKLDREQLLTIASTDGVEPLVTGDGPTLAAATTDGNAVLADIAAGRVVFLRPDGATDRSPEIELTDGVVSITSLGPDTAVLADTDGDLVLATPARTTALTVEVLGADGGPAPVVLQQPGSPADQVVAATIDGRIVAVPLADGREVTEIGQLAGTAPTAPIAHGGCVFAVSTSPATFTQWCADGAGGWTEVQQAALDGAGSELRLRLVNGWVWINDVDTGAAWVTSPQQRLDRIDDWGSILSRFADDDADDSTDDEGGEVVTEVNPDDPTAEIVQSDEIDQEGPNRPPVARDDEAQTRVDRPIDIDVLANDTDPNGDVLVVTAVEPRGGDASVQIAPDGRSVQVTPAAGYSGPVSFGYTITDGRDASASAAVSVQVAPSDGTNNRPPEAHNDIASTRRGRPTSFDVLGNDVDPDGDALVLDSIALADPATAGQLVPDPSGQVVFTPDPNTTAERIELTYTVSDDFGATDEGTVIVSVRLADANNEPDARNDAGVTVVGKPLRLDVLANDTDPDDDPLFVAQQPTLVRPADRTTDSLDLSLTPDGELFFNPDTAGTFVFNYSATDGEETDVAQIRVEVGAATENRPPTAIRDDVVIPAGGSRLVYVLENDGDPDGDVIGLAGHVVDPASGLTVKEVDGIGYLVSVAPDAPARPTFRYLVSDGVAEPVSAVVVVAVTDGSTIDQPPVARADVTEVRAGGKVRVPILANDYDPEGGALEVVDVTPWEGVDVAPGLNGQTVDVRVGTGVVASFTLGYTVADVAGNRSSAFIDVQIVPADEVNRPPIARTDIARTTSGSAIRIAAVANDSDPDGDIIAVNSVRSQPAGGVAAVEDGEISYTPNATFSGTDRLTYSLVDAGGELAIGEVLIGVQPLPAENRAPEAFDDRYQAVAGSAPLVFDVRANDSDPDGDTVRVTTVSAPVVGAAAVADDGSGVVFTPPADVAAPGTEVAFTYAIDDGRGGIAQATVTVDVTPAGESIAPVAVDDLVGPLTPGQSIQIDLLANDLDPDGNPIELTVSSDDPALAAREGSVVTVLAGPTSSRHTYTITDAAGLTDTAEVDVLVVDNRAPEVRTLAAQTAAGAPITVELASQVSDPDGDTLYFTCCDNPRGGAATTTTNDAGALAVTFTPDDGFAGPASFAYTVDDQQGHLVAGAVTVEVLAPTNRPPVMTGTIVGVEAGVPTNIDLAALATDPDPGDVLTFATSEPAQGAVTLTREGAVVVASAPIDGAERTDSFDVTVTDTAGQSAVATVQLTVTPPDAPPPQARGDAVTTDQGQAVTVAALDNDIDPLGGGLTITDVLPAQGGSTSTDGRVVSFRPDPEFFGTTSLVYVVRDEADLSSRQAEGQVAVTVIGRPAAPGSPVAQAGNGTATITWAAPATNGAPIDEFEVRLNGGETRAVGAATGYTWSGLPNGQPVAFEVRAHNSADWGPWSGASAPVTPDIEPGRPAAPTVQFTDEALVVTWSAPTNEGSAITNYDIEIGGSASAVQRVGAATTFTWEGLTNGQEYTFRVRAVNAKGNGQFSSPSAPEHPLRQPDAPAAPVGERGSRFIDVSWAAPGNGGDPIIEYEVTLVSTGAVNRTTSTVLRWSNLPNGQAQQFQVRARNRAGWGALSPASAPVVPCGVPDAPTAVNAQRGDGFATVSWTAPGDQGCAIVGYTVTSSPGGATNVGGGQTSARIDGLRNGTSYTFTVVARNEVGDSARSAASNAVTPAGLPGAPRITSAEPGLSQVRVDWTAADPNGDAVVNYQLRVDGGGWEDVGNRTSYTRGGLANSTQYTFEVRAANSVGVGPASNAATARTPGEPGQPNTPALDAGNRLIDVYWGGAPPDNGSPVTRFEVEIDSGGIRTFGPSEESTTYTGLTNGQVYGLRTRACNAVGCGPWSPWAYAMPRPPRAITVTPGDWVDAPECGQPNCPYLHIDAEGLEPNHTYDVDCFTQAGKFADATATSTARGTFYGPLTCYRPLDGSYVWVTFDGVRSNITTWRR